MAAPKDIVVDTLKKEWFDLALKENYPHTPEITQKLDNLQQAIKELAPDKAKTNE